MSDLAKLIQTGRRSLSRQEEITEGKVWNPATQRYRQKLTPKEAYRQGLLYVSALNIYLDYTKFPTRCLEIEIEKQSRLVWYTASNHYCYKRSPEQEKEINVVYDFESNTYSTPIKRAQNKERTPSPESSDQEGEDTILEPPELPPEPNNPQLPNPPPAIPPVLEPAIPVIPPDPVIPVIPPEPVEPVMGEPRYQLRNLPSFSGDKGEDPQYFIHKFENFLRCINLIVADGEAVENALHTFRHLFV